MDSIDALGLTTQWVWSLWLFPVCFFFILNYQGDKRHNMGKPSSQTFL